MKNNQPGMTVIVKTITRLTVGLILIYGIYITLQGNTGPGGGFAGGIIIALSFVHLMLAFGKDAVLRKINLDKGIFIASLGAVIFLVVIASGTRNRNEWFFSGAETAVAVAALASLFAMFLALVLLIGKGKMNRRRKE